MTGLFAISQLRAGGGVLGLSPLPGRYGPYCGDVATLLGWAPDMVLSVTGAGEMARFGAAGLGDRLRRAAIDWRHLPVDDFGTPGDAVLAAWPGISAGARRVLERGGRVLAHCAAGRGRSGMVVLRLMVEAGEAPGPALARLRALRPGAVETEAQLQWACGESETRSATGCHPGQ